MKKIISRTLIALTLCFMFLFTAACGISDVNSGGESKRIEVKCVVAGFGTSWLTEAAKEFNEIYADEGYEVVITETDTELGVLNEISIPKSNSTDIFFEYNIINNIINKSKSVLRNNNDALLEDLSDVYNSPAIGKDKKEQGSAILSRFDDQSVKKAVSYTGALRGFDGMYGLPWQGGTTGIYVNPSVLTKAGYSLDDLLTTDKMIAAVENMAPADPLSTTAVFPIAWSGLKAPGYWDYLMQTLFAQYEGKTDYENFWNFIPKTGTTVDNGYSVYESRGIYEALKVVEKLENKDFAAPGTSSMDHIAAQARVLTGKSALVVSGDWLYKEMQADYGDYLENVIAVRTPVISALGVKLGLCGATHAEGVTCAACDNKLASVIKKVDSNQLSDEEIALEEGVTKEKVATVRERRGYYQGGIYSSLALVPSYSNAKVGAKLFLRYLYSDDGMATYKKETYVDLPASYTVAPDTSGYNNYLKSMSEKTNSLNSKPIIAHAYNSPLRSVAAVSMYPKQGTIVAVYTGMSYSHSNAASKPTFTAQEVFDSNISYVKASWPDYVKSAGLE